ncbi:IS110 family transposase ISStma8 [Xanthomonas hortorum pv. vitians]|uniref:IS110 family transposase ISStma8 n=1 Tax=Xanthomonas hortorum pv. vitians TaxID=83224 RepID=A0A6V7EZ09_9XANT|nr:IS110 family transposase ISStma8 [Xanthomonas hortorum pv. vitians]CAD0356286.1 IS110 family transposase ISStma8 [Xanthomonas hortorum pv. vitians]
MNGIGIDVCKAWLDVAVYRGLRAVSQHPRRPSQAGVLAGTARGWPDCPGGLWRLGEQRVLDALFDAGHRIVRVISALLPCVRQAAIGLPAKTDRLDAINLACMAHTLELRPYHPTEPGGDGRASLQVARQQLVEPDNKRAQPVEQVTDTRLRRVLQANIAQMKKTCVRLEQQIAEQVGQQPQLKQCARSRASGRPCRIASCSAGAGHLDGKTLGLLVGVAPIAHDSGQMRGPR